MSNTIAISSDVERAFLADIAANPADDSVRLIFCDWLADHDDDDGKANLAEFIRAQIAVAQTGQIDCQRKEEVVYRNWGSTDSYLIRCGECEFCQQLQRAENQHIAAAGTLTADPYLAMFVGVDGFAHDCNHHSIHEVRDNDYPTLYFWRGFVHAVYCRQDFWLANGPAIVCRQPVEFVRLTDREPYKDRNGGYFWSGPENHIRPVTPHIDQRVFDRLPVSRDARTKEASYQRLAQACLKWARS